MSETQPFALSEKIVGVVGAASGIGESVAIGLGRQGAHVTCLDVDTAGADRVAEGVRSDGGRAASAALDLRDADSVVSAFERLHAFRTLTPGVQTTASSRPWAACSRSKALLDYTDEEYDRVVDLNLKGSFRVLRAAGRIMVPQGHGSIVLFSSIRSQVVEPGQGVYAATKAGIVQLVRTAAAEFGPAGVRVNAVAPGVVETPLTAPIKQHPDWYQAYASKNALGRWARADEMAGPTAFLVSDAASYVTGSVLFVDGGWTAIDGRFTPPGT